MPADRPDRTSRQTPQDIQMSAELSSDGPARLGEYILGEPLGVGGMGKVYAARHVRLERAAAVKMILGPASEREVRLFLAEAASVARVRHPNVVQVYDCSVDPAGRPFLAMEHLPGGTLADRLADGGRMPPAAAAGLLAQIADGVQAAHAASVIHRDLKPSNVLFDAAGVPKVGDFGLAKRQDTDMSITQGGAGTPLYMSPEQVQGQPAGPTADVWALGVILFECLTGRRPFEGDVLSTQIQIVSDPPPPPHTVAPDVPRELERVVLKCLEKEPTSRYPTAAALAADLRQFQAGRTGMDRVRTAFQAAKAELTATAAVTAEHARRATDQAGRLLKRKQLQGRLPDAQAALGEAAAAAGLGDPGLRQQLATLDERIRNVQAAQGSVRQLAVERRGVLIRLAEPFAADPDPPVGEPVAGRHAAVRAVTDELAAVQREIAAAETLVPPTGAAKRRLAVGVAVPVILAVCLGYLLFGRSAPKPPPTAPDGPAPVAVVTAVAGNAALKASLGLVVCGARVTDAAGKTSEEAFGHGTAFAVTPDGVLVTNKHVVEQVADLKNAKHTLAKLRAEKGLDVVPTVWVYFGKDTKLVADLVHVSEAFDLAVLKVDRRFDRVFALRSDPDLPPGLQVFALGYPGAGNEASTPQEVATQLARRQAARPKVEASCPDKQFTFVLTGGRTSRMLDRDGQAWVQHDATIHPGNSGGPLVGEDGVVMGVNTLKYTKAEGISMSLGLPQLKAELEPHAPGLVWK